MSPWPQIHWSNKVFNPEKYYQNNQASILCNVSHAPPFADFEAALWLNRVPSSSVMWNVYLLYHRHRGSHVASSHSFGSIQDGLTNMNLLNDFTSAYAPYTMPESTSRWTSVIQVRIIRWTSVIKLRILSYWFLPQHPWILVTVCDDPIKIAIYPCSEWSFLKCNTFFNMITKFELSKQNKIDIYIWVKIRQKNKKLSISTAAGFEPTKVLPRGW